MSWKEYLYDKIGQYATALTTGTIVAFEGSIPYFSLCFFVIICDIFSAWELSRRLHSFDPVRYDGKFKSDYKSRVLRTMIYLFTAILGAGLIDAHLLHEGSKQAVSAVLWAFIVYTAISIVENITTANPHKGAKFLQRFLANKSKRHLNVDISDLFNGTTKEQNNDTEGNHNATV